MLAYAPLRNRLPQHAFSCFLVDKLRELISQIGILKGGPNAADPSKCLLSWQGSNFCPGGWRNAVALQLMNGEGVRIRHGNHPVVVEVSRTAEQSKMHRTVPSSSAYLGEGSYEISFSVLNPGTFSVSARVFGEHVGNSPLSVQVSAGPVELLWGLNRGTVLGCSSTYESNPNYGPENLRSMDTSSSWMASSSGEEYVELGTVMTRMLPSVRTSAI